MRARLEPHFCIGDDVMKNCNSKVHDVTLVFSDLLVDVEWPKLPIICFLIFCRVFRLLTKERLMNGGF